jgi:hypothetical protein
MTQGARRAFATCVVLVLMVGAACIFFTSAQTSQLRDVVGTLQAAVLASCGFAADVGSVPLPPSPRPSKLGVSLVADSRQQWRKLNCPGTLPMPPGFAHWAAVYHLPAS